MASHGRGDGVRAYGVEKGWLCLGWSAVWEDLLGFELESGMGAGGVTRRGLGSDMT